jgi:putative protease
LDAIPRLKALGVASLKIEGRLRRADYVRRVVEAYRLMLDTPDDQVNRALKEARHILSSALGRKWFQGFRSKEDFKEAIRHQALGASGLLVGRVARASETGFMLEVSRPVRLHDTIRVQPVSGDEGPLLTVTKMTVDDKEATQAKRGQQCWIHYDRKVDANAPVFKTGSVVAPLTKRVASLPFSRPEIDLAIELRDGAIRVTPDVSGETWTAPLALQPARKVALAPETVSEAFRHAGSGTLSAGRIVVKVPENVFLPASQLKRARRAFWAWAGSAIDPGATRERWFSSVKRIKADLLRPVRPSTRRAEVVVNLGHAPDNPVEGAWSARPVSAGMKTSDEVVLPDFCAEDHLPKLTKQIDDLVRKGARRFRVTSIYAFDLLAPHDGLKLNLSAGFPLPVCNRYAVEALRDHGVRKTMAWVELEQPVIESLVERFGSALEVFTHGRVPILSTRMAIPVEGDIRDGRGAKFTVKGEKGLTWILPEKVLSIMAPPRASTYIDLRHAGLREQATDSLNYFRELV